MQRRAIRDAKTPDKMKKSKFVKADSNLTLQEKKEKIQSGLKKLTELGTVDPKNRYQELINDVAKVLCGGPGAWPCRPLSQTPVRTGAAQTVSVAHVQCMGRSCPVLGTSCLTEPLPALRGLIPQPRSAGRRLGL